ncbi:MAG: hypothetical protein WCO29_08460 [Nostocales cyanobacterium ELA583]
MDIARIDSKGFGNLGSKTLTQVTNHFDWCPEHIQVKGKGVEGIVAVPIAAIL